MREIPSKTLVFATIKALSNYDKMPRLTPWRLV